MPFKYLTTLDFTTGDVKIFDTRDIDPLQVEDFDYTEWVENNFPANIYYIIHDNITFIDNATVRNEYNN